MQCADVMWLESACCLQCVSVSVHMLANNAFRAHHASVHGGVSADGLSDIC